MVKRYVAAMIRDAKTEEGLTEENFKVRGSFFQLSINSLKLYISINNYYCLFFVFFRILCYSEKKHLKIVKQTLTR